MIGVSKLTNECDDSKNKRGMLLSCRVSNVTDDRVTRLDLQYHAFRLAYGDQTHFAPITEKPEHILDVGTGTGALSFQSVTLFND